MDHALAIANNNQAFLTVVEVIEKMPSIIKPRDSALLIENLQVNIISEHQNKLREMVSPSIRNIEVFYNRERIHSANDYLSPVDYEIQHIAV